MASDRERLAELVEEAVEDGLYTALVTLVGGAEGIAQTATAGSARPGEAVAVDSATLFDLASLTKTFTAGLALTLDAAGELPLALPIGEAIDHVSPELTHHTLADLLSHRAGFVPWAPLYAQCANGEEVRQRLLDGSLLGASVGTYSDLGFILWGLIAEERCGLPLATLFADRLLDPLGFPGPRPAPSATFAACQIDGGKEVELAAKLGLDLAPPSAPALATSQDGNARFLGGLAGHAGLFASAEQLWCYAREWLVPGPLFAGQQLGPALAGPGPFLLGWGRPGAWSSTAGMASPSSFGALGFTGGSLWIEPERGRIALVVGHRASPFSDLAPFRRAFHALAWKIAV